MALVIIILLNLGLNYAMNVWNRAIFDALEKRENENVLFLSLIYFPILAASIFVCSHAGLCAHDDAKALARMAEHASA